MPLASAPGTAIPFVFLWSFTHGVPPPFSHDHPQHQPHSGTISGTPESTQAPFQTPSHPQAELYFDSAERAGSSGAPQWLQLYRSGKQGKRTFEGEVQVAAWFQEPQQPAAADGDAVGGGRGAVSTPRASEGSLTPVEAASPARGGGGGRVRRQLHVQVRSGGRQHLPGGEGEEWEGGECAEGSCMCRSGV